MAEQCHNKVFHGSSYTGSPCRVPATFHEKDIDGEMQWWCRHHAPSRVKAKKKARQERFEANNKARDERYEHATETARRLHELTGVTAKIEYADWKVGATGGIALTSVEADKLIEVLTTFTTYSAWHPDVVA